MSPAFKRAVSFILEREGGSKVTEDPADPGGLTKWGISQRSYPAKDIRNLSQMDAEEIYHTDYWLPIHGDDLPQPLAVVVFDAAVNQGRSKAIDHLQRLVRVERDGVIGPDTLNAARRTDFSKVVEYCEMRLADYEALIQRHPVMEKYISGWRNRILWVMREATKFEVLPA